MACYYDRQSNYCLHYTKFWGWGLTSKASNKPNGIILYDASWENNTYLYYAGTLKHLISDGSIKKRVLELEKCHSNSRLKTQKDHQSNLLNIGG